MKKKRFKKKRKGQKVIQPSKNIEIQQTKSKIQKPKPKIFIEEENVLANDSDSINTLKEGFYGEEKGEKLLLNSLEALYLMIIRTVPCYHNDKPVGFSYVMEMFKNEPRFFSRYNVFRDWRDRGIIIQFPERMELKNFGRSPSIRYPSDEFKLTEMNTKKINISYLPEDMVSFVDDVEIGKQLFEQFWFGQLGIYKQQHRDNILKLDFIETLFLAKQGFSVKNVQTGESLSFEMLLEMLKEKRPDISALFDVYEDWRSHGYIIKTGFKFGTHFRIYFPGASPVREKTEWIHSKHVIHVFPKDAKMIMSEWARAVRVAHSVKKTFIMAIPGMTEDDYKEQQGKIDFIGFHRKKIGIEKPDTDNPKFAIISFTEDEELGGKQLASALSKADELGLRLMIGISDRETAVTYYIAKRIELHGSRNKYYEVEWIQP